MVQQVRHLSLNLKARVYPWDPHGRREELTSTLCCACPHIDKHTHVCTHTNNVIIIIILKRVEYSQVSW